MKKVLLTYCLCSSFYLMAQTTELKREIKYTTEIGTYLSTDENTPFWLRANQYGIVPLTSSPIITLRGSISADYKKAVSKEDQYKLSKFDWGYGLNVVGNVGKENQFLIPEAYIKAKFGAFEIYAGRRKEVFGLVDSTLSSGSYIWSGNALPMPKIQIMNSNFVPLPFTKGFLSFKGSFAHGWFENDRVDVKDFYLHQKTLYFRLGKPNWKFKFYGGFNHQVQWGGTLKYPDPTNQYAINGQVGSSISDYFNVVTGRSLAGVGDTTKNGANDAYNRSGNHLGTIDFGFEVVTEKVNILCYRQNIYEDGSLYYLANIVDGLNGMSFTFKKQKNKRFHIQKLILEYLNTTSQSGATGSDNTNARLRGRDSYFDNGVYQTGWTYKSNIIGTPFITSIHNSRVESYYGAINAVIKNIEIETKLSFISSLGSYNTPSVKQEQFLGVIKVIIPTNLLGGTKMITQIAFDSKNTVSSNPFGVYIGMRKNLTK